MNNEEILSIDWLNLRHAFDDRARNKQLLHKVIQQLAATESPVLADLGSGTGNNILSLIDHLPESCELFLIEQHAFLLNESRQRLMHRQNNQPMHFICSNLHCWLSQTPKIDCLTNNALLDLFTQSELALLLKSVDCSGAMLYSTLNYHGIQFTPEQPEDQHYSSLFEAHMCRQLDRGKPLGPKVIYRRGIETQLTNKADHRQLQNWLNEKHRQLEQHQLHLTVKHLDFLITPLNHCGTGK